MPGGRRTTSAPHPPRARAEVAPAPISALPAGTGLNPLVGCASPSLIAAGQLRNSVTHPDPQGLRSGVPGPRQTGRADRRGTPHPYRRGSARTPTAARAVTAHPAGERNRRRVVGSPRRTARTNRNRRDPGRQPLPLGRATINREFLPLLEAIGEALQQLPGKVLVTGHTDSVPIRTLKFPSSQVLSAQRARNVAGRLRDITGQPDRFTAKGLADSRLRMPRDPTHARNQRVEIRLRHPAQTA